MQHWTTQQSLTFVYAIMNVIVLEASVACWPCTGFLVPKLIVQTVQRIVSLSHKWWILNPVQDSFNAGLSENQDWQRQSRRVPDQCRRNHVVGRRASLAIAGLALPSELS